MWFSHVSGRVIHRMFTFPRRLDQQKGCRPEQLVLVGDLPNCRPASQIFLRVDIGLGKISVYWRGQAV